MGETLNNINFEAIVELVHCNYGLVSGDGF
jgi:hypothetical protein